MTCPAEFPGYRECDKIDACAVNAYTNIALDPANPTGIILDTSWNTIKLDLMSIVKAGETITHMELVPEDNPTAIRYTRENGEVDCITGDEISRMVSLRLLKDVDQDKTLEDGDVYVYNSTTNLFEPYNVATAITNLNTYLGRLEAEITSIKTRLSDIEGIIPFWPQDKTTKVARGQINIISDPTNNNDKTYGLFTHDKATDQYADEYFA